MTQELIQKIEEKSKVFETAMNGLETFKSELAKKVDAKLDAIDQAKFDRIVESIGKAGEEAQAIKAQIKAVEEKNATLEAALNRPAPATSAEAKDALKTKANELFNKFARNDKHRELHFDDFAKANLDDAELKALSVGNDADGGYLVTPQFGGIVNTFVYESSPIRQLATVTTIGTDVFEVVVDNGEITSGWVGETESRAETNTPVLGKLSIPVHELYAEPRATQKMLDDGIVDMEAWLAGKVAEHFARKEATAFVGGSGVNQPKGLLSYDSGTTVASQQVEQVNSGSSSTFTYNGLINLTSALKEAYQPNAVFLTRRASLADLLQLKDGQQMPIFNMTYSKTAGVEQSILGKSLYFAADVPAVAGNALAMIYGDMKQAYQIVDRIGLRVLRDAYTAKPYVKFYTTKRVGGGVVNFEAFKIGKIST
jgi:HK97 family phage major capsid protein